jgi:hypothetical protein
MPAAGISSRLAAIGGTAGGAMTAATMRVIAAPAVAAAVLGYLIYRLTLRLSSSAPPATAIRPAPSRG